MRFGIIGAGNMGEAIVRGALKQGALNPEETILCDIDQEKANVLADKLHMTTVRSIEQLAKQCDVFLIAIKPNVCSHMLEANRVHFADKALISIVAGWSRERIAAKLPQSTRILRVMPNTPAMVGEGMIVFEKGDTLTEEERSFAKGLFDAIGKVESVGPEQMDAVTAVSGSGPAYVYLFIEALGDAGVRAGLPRRVAYELAAQTVLGSARMVQDSDLHPGELKDRVCSPGGTTIEAVAALEDHRFRGAIMAAVDACYKKSREMGK